MEVRVRSDVVLWITHGDHVMQGLFDGGVMMFRDLGGVAVMIHPLVERLLHLRAKQRRGEDAERENHVRQILPQAAHGDTPARV